VTSSVYRRLVRRLDLLSVVVRRPSGSKCAPDESLTGQRWGSTDTFAYLGGCSRAGQIRWLSVNDDGLAAATADSAAPVLSGALDPG
jgi:hypothetical protein